MLNLLLRADTHTHRFALHAGTIVYGSKRWGRRETADADSTFCFRCHNHLLRWSVDNICPPTKGYQEGFNTVKPVQFERLRDRPNKKCDRFRQGGQIRDLKTVCYLRTRIKKIILGLVAMQFLHPILYQTKHKKVQKSTRTGERSEKHSFLSAQITWSSRMIKEISFAPLAPHDMART